MDPLIVPLICFFGGELSLTNSVDYIGGRSAASFITKLITISELHNKAKMTCGITEGNVIKLKCRYPLNQSMAIALDVCDESSLAVAMSSIPTLSSSLVVYVEEISRQSFAPLGQRAEVEDVGNDVNQQHDIRDTNEVLETGYSSVTHRCETRDTNEVFGEESPSSNAIINQGTGKPVTNSYCIHQNARDVEDIQEELQPGVNLETTLVDVPDFYKGQIFVDRDTFKLAICEHAIRVKRELKPVKSNPSMVAWKCKDKNCKWRIRAMKQKELQTFRVTLYFSLHICSSENRRNGQDHSQATIKWVTSKFSEKIERHQDLTPRHIMIEIEAAYGIKILYSKAVKAKRAIEDQINWSHVDNERGVPPTPPKRRVGRPRKNTIESPLSSVL